MTSVISGLEHWLDRDFSLAGIEPGSRVALLSHAASIDSLGRHTRERLVDEQRISLVKLFAPEHGLSGRAQDMEGVNDEQAAGSLPVVSLYGETYESLRPSPEDLADLDAVVCDVQDVGARYYTYVYTISFIMEVAAERGVPVVLLDRPNPIGGQVMEGPVLRPELASFVGRFPIPVRHAMTAGELARLFNVHCGIGCELRVVPMAGWNRGMDFEQTGLPWVPPSPNMPSPATARVYPGGCLIEGTNLSEARGTTTPFELVGAPWIDGDTLARTLREAGLPGVTFRSADFRPQFQKHAMERCEGVQVLPTDREQLRSFATYLAILRACHQQDPQSFAWRTETYEFVSDRLAIDLLLGRPDLRERILSDEPLERLIASWSEELQAFESIREAILIY